MKRLFFFLLSGIIPFSAFAAPETCAEKKQALEAEIARAEASVNGSYRLKGLNEALKNLEAGCTDEGLREKAEEKIEKAREKVKKAENDLQEAVDKGKDAAKTAKKRNRLLEEQQKLRNLEAGL